jgi:quinolinate synthase
MKHESSRTMRETIRAIEDLKRERAAVILAHNYQRPEVQELADLAGDSLELARAGREADARVIVLCGVRFMAETAAMMSPGKTVLLPDAAAGCPMADMATGEQVRAMRAAHPGAVVVCYVNSTAEVKAASDVCCTSSNALRIIGRVEAGREIVFVPDRSLGGHAMRATGRTVHLWPGHCPVHHLITLGDVERARAEAPGALLMVHPECREEVSLAADMVLSTGQMCEVARSNGATRFLVGTEPGLLHRLSRENPGKTFIPVRADAVCPDMKLIDPAAVLRSLERMETVVRVDEAVRARAAAAVARMFEDGPITPWEG